MLRSLGVLWLAFAFMVSLFLNQLAESTADRYAHAAAAVIETHLANAPQALSGGRTGCSRIPADTGAWDRETPQQLVAARLAWDAAVAADAAIGRRIQDRPRFVAAVDSDADGRAGFVSVAAGDAAAGEGCDLYVRVEITPLGTPLPWLRAHSIVCTRYADHEPPRPCTPSALSA